MSAEERALVTLRLREARKNLAPHTLRWLEQKHGVRVAALPLPSPKELEERVAAHVRAERARGVRVR